MRRSKADKAVTHAKILAVAAKRFRERGLDGIGVADVMKEAGSSAGGFYKHFNSREELVIEALAEAFKFLDRLEAKAENLPHLLQMFLSEEHFKNQSGGCALTALVNDVSHATGGVRTVYTQRLKQTLAYYTDRVDEEDARARRKRAILLFCAASGGLSMARAVNDPALSQEILEALRDEMTALVNPNKTEKDPSKGSR